MGCIMLLGTPRVPYVYTGPICMVPPRVFLGILLEYNTHKYSPELVNKDFGDFLVPVYIVYRYPPVAHAWGVTMDFFCRLMEPLVATLLA